jgi:hypothetical protein
MGAGSVWSVTLEPDLAEVWFSVGANERMPPVAHRPPDDHYPLKAGPQCSSIIPVVSLNNLFPCG